MFSKFNRGNRFIITKYVIRSMGTQSYVPDVWIAVMIAMVGMAALGLMIL